MGSAPEFLCLFCQAYLLQHIPANKIEGNGKQMSEKEKDGHFVSNFSVTARLTALFIVFHFKYYSKQFDN